MTPSLIDNSQGGTIEHTILFSGDTGPNPVLVFRQTITVLAEGGGPGSAASISFFNTGVTILSRTLSDPFGAPQGAGTLPALQQTATGAYWEQGCLNYFGPTPAVCKDGLLTLELSAIPTTGTINGVAVTYGVVPEPGTGLLVGIGLLALTRSRRRWRMTTA
jgi:hypothetical protein